MYSKYGPLNDSFMTHWVAQVYNLTGEERDR